MPSDATFSFTERKKATVRSCHFLTAVPFLRQVKFRASLSCRKIDHLRHVIARKEVMRRRGRPLSIRRTIARSIAAYRRWRLMQHWREYVADIFVSGNKDVEARLDETYGGASRAFPHSRFCNHVHVFQHSRFCSFLQRSLRLNLSVALDGKRVTLSAADFSPAMCCHPFVLEADAPLTWR